MAGEGDGAEAPVATPGSNPTRGMSRGKIPVVQGLQRQPALLLLRARRRHAVVLAGIACCAADSACK